MKRPQLRRRNPSSTSNRLRAAAFEALETRMLFSGGGDGGGADPIEPDIFSSLGRVSRRCS